MEYRYIKYAEDVLSGKVVAGELVKLACSRFLSFLDNPDYVFKPEKVQRIIDFYGDLRHYTGRHVGKPFILEDWQTLPLAALGFYRKEDDTRLIRQLYIEMARKQGKTAYASALCCYGLIADGEWNAEVDLAANNLKQAKICFEMCQTFCKTLDPKKKYLQPYRDKIKYLPKLSNLLVFPADASGLDGFNAHFWCLDEYHAAKNQQLFDVLVSSQGSRENGLGIIITTAGFDKLGPCYNFRTNCVEVLHGVKQDDTLFPLIYCLDEGDDWRDENVWIKSNPNLGVTVRKAYLREQIQRAINNPSDEVGVKTKNLNMWCDAENVWIPDHYVLDATQKLDLSEFKGCECYVGVDLSSVSDLTAVSFMIPKDDKMYFFNKCYLPEAALQEKRLSEQYRQWRMRGDLTITAGNVVDYDYILNDILDVGKDLFIQKVAYDTYNATQWAINATERGLCLEPYSQTLGNFNRPTKEFERLMLAGKIVLDNNIVTRHCLRNVELARDRNGNVKPTKQYGEDKKIDIVVAMLEAMGVFLLTPRYGEFY